MPHTALVTAIVINIGRDLAALLGDHPWIVAAVLFALAGLYLLGRRDQRRDAAERRELAGRLAADMRQVADRRTD